MKFIKTLLPLWDHLYIFQLLEYEPRAFLKWFIKNPFRRNLEKKQRLILTPKAVSLLTLSAFLIFAVSAYLNLIFLRGIDWPVVLIFFLYFQMFSPLFIISARFMLIPYENYSKNKLLQNARNKLSKLPDLKIVAITGSYAKTSTKNMLYTLLWKKYHVVKTPKSYNNPLSIAQTIMTDVKDNTQIFIVEVGAYKLGEIKNVVSWLKPEIGIITGIAPQHLERFGSLENIAKAKFELVEGLPKNGTAILNGENNQLIKLAKKGKHKKIFFSTQNSGIYASDIRITKEGTSFKLFLNLKSSIINLPLTGEQHVQNFVAASAAALQLGMTPEELKERALSLLPTPHRLEITKKGNMTIIDNGYNTNPDSSKQSFKLLKDYPGKQKIIITPGLVELGEEQDFRNKEFAKEAAGITDIIIIEGKINKSALLAGLKAAKFPKEKTHSVKDLNGAMRLLGKVAEGEAVVLIENDLPDQYS